MRVRLYSLIILLGLVCTSVYAKKPVTEQVADSVAPLAQLADSISTKKKFALGDILKWPVIGVIYPSLSPETGIAIGAGIQGTWNMPEATTPSSLRVMACYTQYNQWYIKSNGTFYMGGQLPWMLQFTMQYRDYPDKYYFNRNTFVGNDLPTDTLDFGSRRFNTTIEPLFQLPQHWYVGPMLDLIWENTTLPDSIFPDDNNSNTMMWGVGISTLYDTRKGVYYPTRGMFFKFKGFYCEPKLGCTARVIKLDADFRHFITLWSPKNYENEFQRVNGSLIFAYQVRLQAALTNGDNDNIPFQMLPTLGGDEILRGIRANMFRDNTLWALQSELRFPIYRIIHGVAFASVGDVYNTQNWHWAVPKVGYGLGLRVTVNRAHVNVRIDVARNNIDKSWKDANSYSFYITASEAF